MKLFTATALVMAVLGILLWLHSGAGEAASAPVIGAGAPAGQGGATGGLLPATPEAVAPAQAAAPARRAAAGAERNTLFRIDASGDLIVDEAVAERLEALAQTLPPQHSLAELERVEAVAREGLPEPKASQALQLLHNWLAYSKAEALLLVQPRPAEDVASAAAMLQRLAALRREHFGAGIAQALFGAQEAQARATLASLGAPTTTKETP